MNTLDSRTIDRPGLIGMLNVQIGVMKALMLRDLRSRAFGSIIGYFFFILWPLSHILVIVAFTVALKRGAPYGESTALWFATGSVPYLSFSYMARFTMFGVVQNKQLMFFPRVKFLDVVFARAVVEALNAVIVILLLFAIFWFLDIDFMPRDTVQAGYALFAAMLLGLGLGVLNSVIAGMAPFWMTAFSILNVVLWVTSGVMFVPDALPKAAQDILAYHPVLHAVEWMRAAYFEGYGASILDKKYLLWFGVGLLFAGLVGERIMRGGILGR